MKNVILIIAILFASVNTSLAQVKQNSSHKEHHPNNRAKKYTCPMHPEVVRNRPGKCPICGMQLVKIKHKNMGKMDR